jgi:DNA end-binding protein Ku
MAPRAIWKGHLKVGDLSCAVALYVAVSTSERIAFHILNEDTGHRVRRQFVDSETGKPVEREDQAKGYEVSRGHYVMLDPEELAAAVPESDKLITVSGFIDNDEIDEVYVDRAYFIAPATPHDRPAYAAIRDALAEKGTSALCQAVLFRRIRRMLVQPHGDGLTATLLKFNYEVRSAAEIFDPLPSIKIEKEMLDLAKHIIKMKHGHFDPTQFEDRYEEAVSELVKAKLAGKAIKAPAKKKAGNVVSLLDALKASAGGESSAKAAGKKTARRAPARGKTAAPKRRVAASQRKAG